MQPAMELDRLRRLHAMNKIPEYIYLLGKEIELIAHIENVGDLNNGKIFRLKGTTKQEQAKANVSNIIILLNRWSIGIERNCI